jgi:hypothetical protein
LSQLRVRRTTLFLRQVVLEPAESLAIEDHISPQVAPGRLHRDQRETTVGSGETDGITRSELHHRDFRKALCRSRSPVPSFTSQTVPAVCDKWPIFASKPVSGRLSLSFRQMMPKAGWLTLRPSQKNAADTQVRFPSSMPPRIVTRFVCIPRTDRLLRHWTSFGKGCAAKNSDFERGRVATLPFP